MKPIYRLDRVKYKYFDKTDMEDVEERYVLGYFSSLNNIKNAIKTYIENGYKESELSISTFFDSFTYNQKHVYVLSHGYSIYENNKYTDYSYVFQPFSNKNKCFEMMNNLKKETLYEFNPNRIYDDETMEGFYIATFKIDYLYGIEKTITNDIK